MINYDRVRIIKRFIYVTLAVVFFAPAILAVILFIQMQGLKTELYESNAHLDQMTAKYFAPLEDQVSQAPDNIYLPQAYEPVSPEDSDENKEEALRPNDTEDDTHTETAEEGGSSAGSPSANGSSGSIEAELEPASQGNTPPAPGTVGGGTQDNTINPSSGISNPLTGISSAN